MKTRERSLTVMVLLVAVAGGACATSAARREEESGFRARKQLTRALVVRGEWDGAFAYAEELHRQRPDDAEVLTLRGIVYRERRLLDAAESDLRAALALDDGLAEAHAALGIVLDSTQRGHEAESHHRRAVALDGKNHGYLNNLGFSLLLRRKNKDALETLQKAARLAPTKPRVRTNLGFAYAALGDFPRAAREFEMGGAPAEAKNNLGFAYEKRGDFTNAFDLYVAALRIDASCAKARNNLTQLASKLGRELPGDLPAPTTAVGPTSTSTSGSPSASQSAPSKEAP